MIINNTVINKHLTKARFYKNFNGYLQQDESSNLFMLKSPIMIEGWKIRLAADIICGRKQTTDFHNNDYEKWRKDYELVRSNLNLHFLWPKHKAPTINTYRYTKYLDRIDYLLFDLKCYFRGQETPMIAAYQGEETAVWLRQFNRDFNYFIDKRFQRH